MQLDRLLTACQQNRFKYSLFMIRKAGRLTIACSILLSMATTLAPDELWGKERERDVTSLLKYTSNTWETMATAKQCHPKRIKHPKSSFEYYILLLQCFLWKSLELVQALLYSVAWCVHSERYTLYSAPSLRDWENWKSRQAADSLGFWPDRSKRRSAVI